MQRRTLLSRIGAATAVGLAGCVSGGTGGDGGDGNGTATPGGSISLVESSLKPTDGGCGQTTDSAEVTFERGKKRVVVTGTIWASNPCEVPVLDDVTYDEASDELTVIVRTKTPESDGVNGCVQCIAELKYRATAAFDGGLPGSVAVVHVHGEERERVVTASPS